LEDQTKLLAQIARLALGTEEISDRTAS
jgi:hypothetical protein